MHSGQSKAYFAPISGVECALVGRHDVAFWDVITPSLAPRAAFRQHVPDRVTLEL